MTAFILTLSAGILVGFSAGLLVFRNNAVKAASAEARGKALLDALKRND